MDDVPVNGAQSNYLPKTEGETVWSSSKVLPQPDDSQEHAGCLPEDVKEAGGLDTEGQVQAGLMQSMAQLLQAQTQMVAAQAQAVTVQGLPSLLPFTGEEPQLEDDGFDRWIEQFEERAHMAGWSDEQRLYQVKAHLRKTALQVFRMLPEQQRATYKLATQALRKRFRPIDIEELRGIEFHQKMQGEESIEKLGIDLQRLARKAFPKAMGKEFDRLIKGRFFQALYPKWQRKLGAPKPGESFTELYDRARMLEMHEKQYSAAALARETKFRGGRHSHQEIQPPSKPQKQNSWQESLHGRPHAAGAKRETNGRYPTRANVPNQSQSGCYRCGSLGHFARHCPQQATQAEAPGRSKNSSASRTATLASDSKPPDHLDSKPPDRSDGKPPGKSEDWTEEELESMLTKRRLEREKQMLEEKSSKISNITAVDGVGPAVGPTLYLEVLIDGVHVDAMVDTGSQSTIISRALLHAIGRHRHQQGGELPELEKPTVKLFGKDGKKGGKALNITAQTTLTLQADGKTTSVPVFVQPESEQPCLLGMNAAPALGLTFLTAKGQPLRSQSGEQPEASSTEARVCLTQTVSVPGRKGRFLEAAVHCHFQKGDELLFEPNTNFLKSHGLSAQESLLTVRPHGTILIPMQNFQTSTVRLEEGMEIGQVELLGVSAQDDVAQGSKVAILHVQTGQVEEHEGNSVTNCPERRSRLKELLNLSPGELTPQQLHLVEAQVLDNADLFALDDSELGCTGLVQHTIDTADHPPIKQRPRRTPFV